jgi:fumarate reductase subunit C
VPGFLRSTGSRVGAFAVLGIGAGVLAGVVWWAMVDLPLYRIQPDSSATTGERDLTEFIAGDAWFCLIGVVVGLGLGVVGWRYLRSLGWPLVVIVVVVALGAALLCWAVGYQLGPGEFERRLATARPGALVPIDLTVRAYASLVVWPFLAVVPVLLGSSLSPDAEEAPAVTSRSERSNRWWRGRGR